MKSKRGTGDKVRRKSSARLKPMKNVTESETIKDQTAEALKTSEEKYRKLADNALIGIYTTNLKGDILYVNDALVDIFEYKNAEEMKNEGVIKNYKNARNRDEFISKILEHGAVSHFELEVITKTGRTKNILINALLEGENITGMMTDITELKRIQSALKESEEKHRDLYENAPDMYYEINSGGIITKCNTTMEKMLGYKKENLVGRHITDFFTKKAEKLFRKDFPGMKKKGREFVVEREFVRSDGSMFTVSLRINKLFNSRQEMIGTRTIARDITDLRRAADKLSNSEKNYRLILENIDEIVYAVDLSHDFMHSETNFMSGQIEDILGYKPEEFLADRDLWSRLIHPDDVDMMKETTQKIISARKKGVRLYRLWNKTTGNYRWLEDRVVPQIDKKGDVIGLFGVARDITERKLAEEVLLEKERKYRTIFEDSRDAVYITTREGRFLDLNEAAVQLFGYSREEMLELDVLKIYADPADRERFKKHIEERGSVRDYELKFVKKDGSVIICLITSSLRISQDGTILGYQGIMRDITERKKIDEERLTFQKLESIGLLAGGIAHDFNNVLTAIMGNVSLAMMYARPDSELFLRLLEVEKASIRARDLTLQLLTFSKGGKPVKRTLSVAECIRESVNLSLIASNVKYEIDLPKKLRIVEADQGQLGQAINNIIINADQAMQHDGYIRILAENVDLDERNDLDLPGGQYVRITIADHGPGIPKENLQRIFEPYFSTKENAQGLGLAVSHSIIKKHEGLITVESAPGTGAVFHIFLPATSRQVLEDETIEEKPLKAKRKVLLMDDEEMIRFVASEIVRQIGYDIDLARNGEEALEMYKNAMDSGHPYDAVILDLTIPDGMGGQDTIRHLIEIDPEIKAIVSSGYSNDPVMANFRDYGFREVIAKPYKIREMNRVLYKVFNGQAAD
jgi:PAS domain S-box-containing protein